MQLWTQHTVPTTFKERLHRLKRVERFINISPSGRKKAHPLTIVQLDADGYFSSTDALRGLKRVKALIKHVQTSHCDGITVFRSPTVRGYIGGQPANALRDRDYMSFHHIIDLWTFAIKDQYMVLGDLVLQQIYGWLMGGIASEEGTSVDATHAEWSWEQHPERWHRQKLAIPDLSYSETLQGIRHVDNVLYFSYVWAEQDLIDNIPKLYPSDMKWSVESQGPKQTFLHTNLHSTAHQVTFYCHNFNYDFVYNSHSAQHQLRIGPYFPMRVRRHAIHQYLQSRVATMIKLYQHGGKGILRSLIETILELIKLGVPPYMIVIMLKRFRGIRAHHLVDRARRIIELHIDKLDLVRTHPARTIATDSIFEYERHPASVSN